MDQNPDDAVRVFKHTMFFMMCVIGLWNFGSNVAARNKEQPFQHIFNFPLWILNIITTTVWCLCTIVYAAITWTYAREHPYWSVGALIVPVAMTGFMVWAGLDIFDWFTWGPLVAVLGVVVCAGIEVVASSVQSGMLRNTLNGLCGLEPADPPPPPPPPAPAPAPNAHAGPDIELANYPRHPLPANGG